VVQSVHDCFEARVGVQSLAILDESIEEMGFFRLSNSSFENPKLVNMQIDIDNLAKSQRQAFIQPYVLREAEGRYLLLLL